MSEALEIHSSSINPRSTISEFSRHFFGESSNSLPFRLKLSFSSICIRTCSREICRLGGETLAASALWQEGPLEELDDSPASIELQPIFSDTQFGRIIGDAHKLGDTVILFWMARWCRNYIYLKPQLEKLAAEYYPRLQFYCVDVNTVTHKLVARAGVTKMPVIQLWKDGKKQDEVIGNHKTYLVINEVRKMIENE